MLTPKLLLPRFAVLTPDPCPKCEGSGKPDDFGASCGDCYGTGQKLVVLEEALRVLAAEEKAKQDAEAARYGWPSGSRLL